MSGIRAVNTKPELVIRSALHAMGFRFRLHAKELPGRPDLVFPKYRAAVFVHGCFWHGHDCSLFRLPGTRQEFWQQKIGRNQARDAEVRLRLSGMGWRQLAIWECAFRGPGQIGLQETVRRAADWIRSDSNLYEIRSETA
ncbi:very short patch repair endonuclease [Mesorhizobium sp. RP14(2022)]|uniref:Very short patch repair endonuclease n=2 Tax=Mesorhizobium liriopis TaxID=2953882 RepID=A0ABT1C9J0_9HYPH|nr:very short patch repair endonuclease [Mesorhizobium liriopis]